MEIKDLTNYEIDRIYREKDANEKDRCWMCEHALDSGICEIHGRVEDNDLACRHFINSEW